MIQQVPTDDVNSVLPRILTSADKSEVKEKFGFWFLLKFCMQLLNEGPH